MFKIFKKKKAVPPPVERLSDVFIVVNNQHTRNVIRQLGKPFNDSLDGKATNCHIIVHNGVLIEAYHWKGDKDTFNVQPFFEGQRSDVIDFIKSNNLKKK
jgi:hypothetical protein